MSMDDHFNPAARGVRDQVAQYPVPALEPGTEPKGSPARYAPTAVFAALALLLGGLVDDSFDDPGLAVAGPRDGKDSVGLPIVVSPAEGLSDGQIVSVSGSGFPANDRLGAVICAHNGPAGAGAGVANCQTGTVTYADSDAAGAFQVEVPATRFIEIAGVGVDCAAAPPVGQPSTCVLAVGSLADYDLSGNTPIWFDADLSVATVPAFEVTPSEGLTDGQEVVVRLTNVAPRSEWTAVQCTNGTRDAHCMRLSGIEADTAVADQAGTAEVTVIVREEVDFGDVSGSCAAAGCRLELNGPPPSGFQADIRFAEPPTGEVDASTTVSTVDEEVSSDTSMLSPVD